MQKSTSFVHYNPVSVWGGEAETVSPVNRWTDGEPIKPDSCLRSLSWEETERRQGMSSGAAPALPPYHLAFSWVRRETLFSLWAPRRITEKHRPAFTEYWNLGTVLLCEMLSFRRVDFSEEER